MTDKVNDSQTDSELLDDIAAEAVAEAAVSPGQDTLEVLQNLGAEVNRINDWLERAEEKMKERKARKNEILGRTMVDIMKEKRIDHVGVDGKNFDLQNYYHASIPEESRDEAHDWLEHHEYGDLIKYEISVILPKDSEEIVRKIQAAIAAISNEAEVNVKRSVPWKRLTSWVKEYYEQILPKNPKLPQLPLETFGATVGLVVKVKDK